MLVKIKPFKGLRYNKERIKDFRLVITPPYDVISEDEREELSKLSECNMVKLILGKDAEEGYAKTAKIFNEWQEKGVLKKDEADSIYIYEQELSYNGSLFKRVSFVSLVELEELGKGILPHEKTLEKPFKDRLTLINAAKADFELVFILYDDRQKAIEGFIRDAMRDKKPEIEFKDGYGIKHRFWSITDKQFIGRLKEEMSKYQCVIADGHHRYKSFLKFKEEHPELEDAKYIMASFVNSFNEGLLILPIDRFVFNVNADINEALDKLRDIFEVEEVGSAEELIKRLDNTPVMIDKTINLKNHTFRMYCFSNKKSYFLKLKNNNALDEYYKDKTDIYRKLDVNILHKLVFNYVLGISEEEQYKGTHIEYTKGSRRALDKLNNSKYQFAFFLKAPLMREIFLTARAGETMPQKSTYFYPKMYSGFVMHKFER